mgnify:CR=1 FL=1
MKAKKNMYAKGGKNDPKKKKKKKKDVKGRDVSVGGNIDYNKPTKKTGFAASSEDRATAQKKLSSKLREAGVLGAEHTKAYQKRKLGQLGKVYTSRTEVSSPMDVKMYGGKVKAVKKYKNGGKNGDPKKKMTMKRHRRVEKYTKDGKIKSPGEIMEDASKAVRRSKQMKKYAKGGKHKKC